MINKTYGPDGNRGRMNVTRINNVEQLTDRVQQLIDIYDMKGGLIALNNSEGTNKLLYLLQSFLEDNNVERAARTLQYQVANLKCEVANRKAESEIESLMSRNELY